MISQRFWVLCVAVLLTLTPALSLAVEEKDTKCGCDPCPCQEKVHVANAIGVATPDMVFKGPVKKVDECDSSPCAGSSGSSSTVSSGTVTPEIVGKNSAAAAAPAAGKVTKKPATKAIDLEFCKKNPKSLKCAKPGYRAVSKEEETSVLFNNGPIPEPNMNMPEDLRKKVIRAHIDNGTYQKYKDKVRANQAKERADRKADRERRLKMMAQAASDQDDIIKKAGMSPQEKAALKKKQAQATKGQLEKVERQNGIEKTNAEKKKKEQEKVDKDIQNRKKSAKSEQLEKKKHFESNISLSPEQKKQLRALAKKEQAEMIAKKNKQDDVTLALENSWSNYKGFGQAKSARLGSWCVMSGLLNFTANWNKRITKTPFGCRPRGNMMFNSFVPGGSTRRMDILKGGNMTIWGGKASAWVTIDGIMYPNDVSIGSNIPLSKDWENYPNQDTAKAMYFREDDACMLTGLVQVKGGDKSKWAPLIGTLPADCRPQGRLAFNVNQRDQTHRVDVLPSGQIQWVSGAQDDAYLSLDGIVFPTTVRGGKDFLGRGWSAYGGNFRKPIMKRVGKVCMLSGVARGSPNKYNRLVGELPTNCRPTSRSMFFVNQNKGLHRMDVLPDGRILWIYGKLDSSKFFSLDGIHFHVGDESVATAVYKGPSQESEQGKGKKKPSAKGSKNAATGAGAKSKPKKPTVVIPNEKRPTVTLKLQSNYTNLGKQFGHPRVTLIGNMCVLEGTLKFPKDHHLPISKIDEGCRPKGDLVFALHGAGSVMFKVKLLSTGVLKWVGGSSKTNKQFLSLQGITYPAPKAKLIPMDNLFGNFVPFEKYDQKPSVAFEGGVCILSGSVRRNKIDETDSIALLPKACRPKKEVIVASSFAGQPGFDVAVSISPTGRVSWDGGEAPNEVSLDGIVFHVNTSGADPLSMVAGYSRYSTTHRAPMLHKHGKYCILSGVAKMPVNKGKSLSKNALIATLPYSCRPDKTQFFFIRRHNVNYRVRVTSNGQIRYVDGYTTRSTKPMLSFNGIQFIATKQSPPSKHPTNPDPEAVWPLRDQAGAVQSQGNNLCLDAQSAWVSSMAVGSGSVALLNDGMDKPGAYWKPHPKKAKNGGHYVAFKFKNPTVLRSFTISLDNSQGSLKNGNLKGLYTLEYTTFARVSQLSPESYWIGVDEFDVLSDTSRRQVFNLHKDLKVRAFRIVFQSADIGFEEIEAFGTPQNTLKRVATGGIMEAKDNRARMANTFASSSRSPKYQADFVNDARYGDDNAWAPKPDTQENQFYNYVGLQWKSILNIASVAIGRDNTGKVSAFATGSYTLQVPSTTNWRKHEMEDKWINVATFQVTNTTKNYMKRNLFNLQTEVRARQLRVVSTGSQVIDEIEVYEDPQDDVSAGKDN